MNVIHSVWIVMFKEIILGVFHSELAAKAFAADHTLIKCSIQKWEIT